MSSGTANENGTRSDELRLPPTPLLIFSRDLAESLDRIGFLEDGFRDLVIALRAVIDRPDFQPGARDEIVEILAKVANYS